MWLSFGLRDSPTTDFVAEQTHPHKRRKAMKKWISVGLAAVVLLIGTFVVVKKVSPVSWGWWGTYNSTASVALKGHDPVAYFTLGQPTLGSSEISLDWGDTTWEFTTVENKELFAQDPSSYAPQFGGFCSFAMSKGFTADIAPDAWHIEEGKLYVFADQNVRDDWISSIGEGSLDASTTNWATR